MLIGRLRQAQRALHEGRLDEACALCRDPRLRSHRRGAELAAAVCDALVRRGKAHLMEDRYPQAIGDCEQAMALGGPTPEVRKLHEATLEAARLQQRRAQREARLLHAARDAIERGSLAGGQRVLEGVGAVDSRAGLLMNELDERRERMETALRRASEAAAGQDSDAAIRELLLARDAGGTDPRVVELGRQLVEQTRRRLEAALRDGRLDLADALERRLERLEDRSIDGQRLRAAVRHLREARDAIALGQPADAVPLLGKVAAQIGAPDWLTQLIASAERADAELRALRGGALQLLGSLAVPREPPAARTVHPNSPTQGQAADRASGPGGLPFLFLLQVDGVGSFLVSRAARLTIGPVGASHACDVPLAMEPSVPPVVVERVDEDYFLRGAAVAVNDRPGNGKLLGRGDRIALGARCRLCFDVPHASSTTAVLDLVAARALRSDVRRVILMDRELVIGPGAAAHIRVDALPAPLVLQARDGRLLCAGNGPATVGQRVLERGEPLPLGAAVQCGGLSFVVLRS